MFLCGNLFKYLPPQGPQGSQLKPLFSSKETSGNCIFSKEQKSEVDRATGIKQGARA
jgi:hypothetical protein